MYPLLLRLRDMDGQSFQQLCFHLLKERHPDAGIHNVEGASGDEGLDIFAGTLSGEPTVWQCKAFRSVIGNSQKQQIRDSLKIALRNFQPKKWILCLSTDMQTKDHRWFQRLQGSYASKVQIGLMTASDIVHELIHRRTLREIVFPGVAIDVQEIQRIVSKTGELTCEELGAVTEANLKDYIERLKERDARFSYEIVFGGDLGPPSAKPDPRVLLRVMKGARTLNVYARDVEALRADPVSISFTTRGSGTDKMVELIRTGISQELTAGEFGDIRSSLFLLEPLKTESGNYKLEISPADIALQRRIRARVTFRLLDDVVEYGFIEFAPSRAGTEEVELKSVGQPFTLRFVVSLRSKPSSFSFTHDFVGAEVRAAAKVLRALGILRGGGELSIYDLEREKSLFNAKLTLPAESLEQRGFRELIEILMSIEERFDVQLRFPAQMTEDDQHSIELLKRFVEGGTEEVTSMEATFEKSAENESTFPDLIRQHGAFRIQHDHLEPKPVIFGTPIYTGPCAMTFERFEVEELEATIDAFRKAKIGDGVPIRIKPLLPARFELLVAEARGPRDSISKP